MNSRASPSGNRLSSYQIGVQNNETHFKVRVNWEEIAKVPTSLLQTKNIPTRFSTTASPLQYPRSNTEQKRIILTASQRNSSCSQPVFTETCWYHNQHAFHTYHVAWDTLCERPSENIRLPWSPGEPGFLRWQLYTKFWTTQCEEHQTRFLAVSRQLQLLDRITALDIVFL